MKTVLILNGQYLPGYKGGGPIQSCVNIIENLGSDYKFKVLCADRDYKSDKQYDGITVNAWNKVGQANVYYMSPDVQCLSGFLKILNDTEYDALYLNGFFSPIFTIKPLILRSLGKLKNKQAKIVITPRGDFTGGLENKKIKKYGYIATVKLLGLYRNLLWHATSDIEERDIRRLFPNARTYMIPNLPAKYLPKKIMTEKKPGKLRLVFVSRIFPKKNIKYALEILQQITDGEIVFDIYGPMEDKVYWEECLGIIKNMPSNISVSYCGEVAHDKVSEVFSNYHAFFFPTLGENYGHVIVEAMMNNCLCILSKGVTPWDEYIDLLDLGASLSDTIHFIEIITRLIHADEVHFEKMIGISNKFISDRINSEQDIKKYKELF
ncbi:glycosyltransferase family 4 protein [Butyrivibrio sp. INlla14]|uniref:glycosyltransferase family 4 protein n=1 Tax=Butyrivibrio sp. INlla14 TaxID=1520808 RepID=UPI000876182D|nr:glycosyltransferase family 4 protein [Butyrivibrio sp. INlla14]SCY50875.1 Glycosyltransferase involved in cell wall bisynthesis [Butyrivibrio sp. INlla14]